MPPTGKRRDTMRVLDRHRRRSDDDEDDANIARDGEVVRVPVQFMDALGRQIRREHAAAEPRVVDTMGNPAGLRPGYVFAARNFTPIPDSLSNELGYFRTAAEKARQDRITRLSEAWKGLAYVNPQAKLKSFGAYVTGQPRGEPGRDGLDAADRSTVEGCEAIREQAWRKRTERLRDAWK
jgi:hypothetical protein